MTMTREEAINAVKVVRQYLTAGNPIFDAKKINETMRMAIEALSEQPQGKWEYCEHEIANYVDGYKCSHCGFFVPWDYEHKFINFIEDYNFCPSCGADMRGENK